MLQSGEVTWSLKTPFSQKHRHSKKEISNDGRFFMDNVSSQRRLSHTDNCCHMTCLPWARCNSACLFLVIYQDQLVGGLELFFLKFHIGNVIIPTDFHIFQRGWNHQPVKHLISCDVILGWKKCSYPWPPSFGRESPQPLTDWTLACPCPYIFTDSIGKYSWLYLIGTPYFPDDWSILELWCGNHTRKHQTTVFTCFHSKYGCLL